MNRFITMLLLATAVCTTTGSVSAQEADRILGIYKVEGETTHELSKVRIYKTGDTYEARIIWLEHPNDEAGKPRLDLLNPDPALRSGRADAIVLVRGLRYDAKKERWTGGTIYNPVDGKVYDVQAEFDGPQELRVRGYIRKAHVRQRPRLGKAGVTHTGRRTEREGGTARGTPSLIFPAESTASSPGHDTLTAHAHAAWEQQRTECAEPNAKETATKSTVHSGPSLLHRQYRPDPRQAHPFRPTPA